MHTDVYDYYILREGADLSDLNERETIVVDGMRGKGPMSRMDVMNSADGLWDIDDDLNGLVSKRIIEMSSLTPTDLMVYMGDLNAGNPDGSRAGVHAVSEKFGMTEKQAATLITEEIRTSVAQAILTKLVDDTMEDG